MIFERYESVEEFRNEVASFLEKNEDVNNLPLGVVGGLSEDIGKYGDKKPFLGLVKDDNENVILVTVMTPPFKLIVTGDGHNLEESIIEAVNYFINESIEVSGIIGASNVAEMFANLWTNKTGCDVVVETNQRIYRLDKVNEVEDSPGRLRMANSQDFDLVKRWINNFVEDCFGEGLNDDSAKKSTSDLIDNERLFIWDDNGPVSMACKKRPTKNGIVIGDVYTPLELRGKGYATSCVAAVSQLLLGEGYRFCSLYTDLANPTSNSIYMKIGYKSIGDSIVYAFK